MKVEGITSSASIDYTQQVSGPKSQHKNHENSLNFCKNLKLQF